MVVADFIPPDLLVDGLLYGCADFIPPDLLADGLLYD